jgi:hypothetical protein
VTDEGIRCYELSPGTAAPATATVAAGTSVGFTVAPDIYHPGPLSFYMARAPSGETAATMTGAGSVWFKIWEDHPGGFGTQALTWPSMSAFGTCSCYFSTFFPPPSFFFLVVVSCSSFLFSHPPRYSPCFLVNPD